MLYRVSRQHCIQTRHEVSDILKAQSLVKLRTVIVDNENAGALNEAGRANADESALSQGRLLDNMQPAAIERPINFHLLRDLKELRAGKSVVGITRIVVQT